MRIFVDTNVLASALATRGLCSELLQMLVDAHQVVVSERVIQELTNVLDVKFHAGHEVISEVEGWLRQCETAPDAGILKGARGIEGADRAILGAAAAARVDFFVTGDREVLRVGSVGDMPIGSPRLLWEELR